MKIDFTAEQFELLMKGLYLGNWLVRSTEEESSDTELDGIEAYILSFAKDFGLERYVDFDEEEKRYYPSKKSSRKTRKWKATSSVTTTSPSGRS